MTLVAATSAGSVASKNRLPITVRRKLMSALASPDRGLQGRDGAPDRGEGLLAALGGPVGSGSEVIGEKGAPSLPFVGIGPAPGHGARAVRTENSRPHFCISPWMRGARLAGFLAAIRCTRTLMSALVLGRPAWRLGVQRQYRPKPSRCQRMTGLWRGTALAAQHAARRTTPSLCSRSTRLRRAERASRPPLSTAKAAPGRDPRSLVSFSQCMGATLSTVIPRLGVVIQIS